MEDKYKDLTNYPYCIQVTHCCSCGKSLRDDNGKERVIAYGKAPRISGVDWYAEIWGRLKECPHCFQKQWHHGDKETTIQLIAYFERHSQLPTVNVPSIPSA